MTPQLLDRIRDELISFFLSVVRGQHPGLSDADRFAALKFLVDQAFGTKNC